MFGSHGHGTPAIDMRARSAAGSPSAVSRRPGLDATVVGLAVLAVLMQALDMASGSWTAASRAAFDVNPISQAAFGLAGPTGSGGVKLAITVAAVVLFLELARMGRVRLAQAFLMLSALMGFVGFLAKVA